MTNPDLPLLDKIALVTGSGRGIGRAIALRLAKGGADVVINFVRNQAPAEEAAAIIRAMGRRAIVVKANLSKPEDIDELFAKTAEEFGGLDIFISNAASGFNRPGMEQKITGWDWTLNVNARAFLFAVQRAAPLMEARKGGAIVAISSPGSTRVMPDYIAVGASKAALEALTRYLAVELSRHRPDGCAAAFHVHERPDRHLTRRGEYPGRAVGSTGRRGRSSGLLMLPGGMHDPRPGNRGRRWLHAHRP